MRFDLSDEEWALLETAAAEEPTGCARVDDRKIVNVIFYVLRTGMPWRDLPAGYGLYTTAYNRRRLTRSRRAALSSRLPSLYKHSLTASALYSRNFYSSAGHLSARLRIVR